MDLFETFVAAYAITLTVLMIVVPLSADGIRYTSIILGAALIVSILGAVALVDYRQVHDEEDVYNRDPEYRMSPAQLLKRGYNPQGVRP
jgi:hypothetical protein